MLIGWHQLAVYLLIFDQKQNYLKLCMLENMVVHLCTIAHEQFIKCIQIIHKQCTFHAVLLPSYTADISILVHQCLKSFIIKIWICSNRIRFRSLIGFLISNLMALQRSTLFSLLALFAFVASVSTLTIGTVNQNNLISFPVQIDGTMSNAKLVIDGNWHWIHAASDMNKNCYPTTTWNTEVCPDPDTCWKACAIEGVPTDQWRSNYGVHVNGDSITMDYVTRHQYGTNVGSRMYIVQPSGQKYIGFNMLGRQLSFEADMSQAGCGLNGAIYFVEMPLDGGPNLSSGNAPSVGLGYCDAQCTDIKFINGKAAGIPGFYETGSCCAQFDVWQANNKATQMTSHVCKHAGLTPCNDDVNCGRKDNRYKGQCDMDGADINPYRLGNHTLFGTGSNFAVDTSKPFTVKTQFITDNGKDTGNLIEIKRYYVQNGKTVFGGSLTDDIVAAQKSKFGQVNYQAQLGGMRAMGEAFKRKMVFVVSFWDDTSPAHMLWLDGVYPQGSTKPGAERGPCPADSGNPDRMRSEVPYSKVTYSKIKVTKLSAVEQQVELAE